DPTKESPSDEPLPDSLGSSPNGQEGPAKAEPATRKASRAGTSRLRTYVSANEGGDDRDRQSDSGLARRRSEIEQAGVARALEYEVSIGRHPKEMSPFN